MYFIDYRRKTDFFVYFCIKYLRLMAKVKRIVVHCTGEPSNAKRNREYYRHFFFEVRRWRHFGYHAVVYQNGTWEKLQPLPEVTADGGRITDATTANGAQGYNSDSLHIAYVGGLTPGSLKAADTRTEAQKQTLWAVIAMWKKDYHVSEVVGHSQLPGVRKACPCFDAKTVYRNA